MNLIRSSRRLALLGAAMSTALALTACGASTDPDSGSDSGYPEKSVNFTIPYAPGGGTDTSGRLLATALEAELGQSVVAVNKEGGGGAIGVAEVAASDPDGYNIGIATDSNVVLQPLLNKDLAYEADDLQTWGLAPATFIVVAAADSPYQTLTDVIAEAKKRPGKIRIAHPGTGGSNDLTARALALAADIDIVPVPITGGGAEINKVVASGQVELAMTTVPVAQGFIDAKRLVIAGTMADEPAKGAEDAESLGGIGVDTSMVPKAELVITAPAGLPEDVTDTLTEAIQTAIDGDFGKRMEEIGFPTDFKDPEESKAAMAAVQAQYEEILEKFEN